MNVMFYAAIFGSKGGGPANAPKEKAQRAQSASLITDLAAHVGDHVVAKATLLEYAEDKVPAIREKALQALSHMTPDDNVQKRLMVCSKDNDKMVRTAAVASMSPTCGLGCLASLRGSWWVFTTGVTWCMKLLSKLCPSGWSS